MAQSVSNDALWEKLSEVEKKLDKLFVEQKTSVQTQEPAEIKPDFDGVKNEIVAEIKEQVAKLGKHSDGNFEANRKNIQLLNEGIIAKLKHVVDVQQWIKSYVESQNKDKKSYFNFRFFKVEKSSFVIAVLGLLVFTLTLFCMKQQNDYARLMNEHYRLGIAIQKLHEEFEASKEKQSSKQQKK